MNDSSPSQRRWALISVSDKSGLADFAAGLARKGFNILSTGGTARQLAAEGLPVTEVSEMNEINRLRFRDRK